jgi:hypothetical protein
MVPRRGRTLSGKGPAGRTVFITSAQQIAVAVSRTHSLDYATTQGRTPKKTAALPVRKAARIDDPNDGRVNERPDASAVTQAVGGAFPLRDVVGDHPRRFHRRLAELGVAGNLALHPLTFGVQQVAQPFQFGDQVFDLAQ